MASLPSFPFTGGWNALLKMEVNSLLSMLGQGNTSKDFFDLIRDIGEAKSKQEEDKIFDREVVKLKAGLAKPDNSKTILKEMLIRLIYCEMLGHNASFGYIHAVKMTQEHKLIDKRVGYLAASILLHENSEFIVLLIHSFRRDLESANFLETCAALTAMCYLLNSEAIPVLLPIITEKLLDHPRELVRKKAVMVLQRMLSRSPSIALDIVLKARKALCDRDPAVMSASLCLFADMIREHPGKFKEIIPSFVSILKQVIDKKLPVDFEFHQVPAPWIQIKLLKLLAQLGVDDRKASEHMYEIINETMKRADLTKTIGYAIVYECIQTITKIYPNNYLLDAAANSISQFIRSTNNNLKYLGITALAQLVQVSPRYAFEHQLAVIDCLEDPDETLRRKTLDLLYKMTNPKNVVVITDKLIDFLRQTTDNYLRVELVSRITQSAERYAPNNQWYIKTMTKVFFLGGELVRPEVAHNMMQLIAAGTGDDEESDHQLKVYAVGTFIRALSQQYIPDSLMQIIAWVLGEFSYLSDLPAEEIIDRISDLLSKPLISSETRGWVITALAKISARIGSIPAQVQDILHLYSNSQSVDVQQKCYEIIELSKTPALLKHAFPVNASCEEVEVDENLSFLDTYVLNAIQTRNVKPYIPHEERHFEDKSEQNKPRPIRWAPYETPKTEYGIFGLPPSATAGSTLAPSSSEDIAPSFSTLQPASNTGLNVPSAAKWNLSGYGGEIVVPSTPSFSVPIDPVETSQPVATPTTPEPEKRKPKPVSQTSIEEEKKKKLASSLFQGVEFTDVSAKPKPPKRNTKTVVASSTAPAPAPALIESEPLISIAPAAQPTQSRQSDFDLLMGMQDLSVSTPAAAPSPIPASAPSPPTSAPPKNLLDLDDIFGSAPSSTPAPTLAPKSSATSLLDSPVSATPSLIPTKFVALDESATQTSSFITNQIFGFPRSHESKQPLTAPDSQLSVSYFKVYKNDEAVVALFFDNLGAKEVVKVSLTLDVPTNFKSELFGDAGVSIRQNQVLIQTIAPRASTVALVKLRFRQHNFTSIITAKGQYVNGEQENKHFTFSIPIELADLLREYPMSTQTFGQLWGSHPQEVKLSFNTNAFSSPAAYVTFLQNKVNASKIEIIGAEAIASAKLINTESLLLIHSKVRPNGVDIMLRTKDKLFTEVAARFFQQLVK